MSSPKVTLEGKPMAVAIEAVIFYDPIMARYTDPEYIQDVLLANTPLSLYSNETGELVGLIKIMKVSGGAE